MAWEGRDPLRDLIYLSVSAFSDSTPSPFLKYPEIRNSDWGESFAQIFLVKLAFLRQKKGINRLTGGPREPRACLPPWGAAPCLVATPDTVSCWFYFPKIINIPKKISVRFIPFGLRLILGFCETKNMQQTGTGTGHWINMLVPKNSIKSCQKYMKVEEYWHGTTKNYRYDVDVSTIQIDPRLLATM